MNWYKRIASKSKATVIKEKAYDLYSNDGLDVWYKKDNSNIVFLSFGDWADHRKETVKMFEDGGCVVEEWDYEVGHPGKEWEQA